MMEVMERMLPEIIETMKRISKKKKKNQIEKIFLLCFRFSISVLYFVLV